MKNIERLRELANKPESIDRHAFNLAIVACGPALLAVVEAAEDVLDNDDTPEPNCSCHLHPPCGDCEQYAGKREIMGTLRKALRALEGEG